MQDQFSLEFENQIYLLQNSPFNFNVKTKKIVIWLSDLKFNIYCLFLIDHN